MSVREEDQAPVTRWFWIDTGWACGGIGCSADGIIRLTPPILKKMKGRSIDMFMDGLKGIMELDEVLD